MRKKPVARNEVRIEGAGSAYAHITTLPRNTVCKREGALEAIPELWAPLVQELNRVAKEWAESPRPITTPEPVPYRCPPCRHCGRRFYRARPPWKQRSRQRTGYYCSDRCQRLANAPARAARRAAFVKERSEQRADARADRECATCGEPIEAKRATMRFCSTTCRVAAHRLRAQRERAEWVTLQKFKTMAKRGRIHNSAEDTVTPSKNDLNKASSQLDLVGSMDTAKMTLPASISSAVGAAQILLTQNTFVI